MFFHDSHNPAYRSPIGPVKADGVLTLRFRCDEDCAVELRTWDGEEHLTPMKPIGDDWFEASVRVPRTPMLLWYDFIIHAGDEIIRYGTSRDQLGGEGCVYEDHPASYQVTVYDPAYQTPEYLRKGIVYQIFPDRFFRDANGQRGREGAILQAHPEAVFHDSWNELPLINIDADSKKDNFALDFFGGTLRGIEEKLDYLQQLGVTILYLNPIFRARSNHRYDTGSYEEIDPILGDNAAFDSLTSAAKARGMQVLLDGVFSHTGFDSLYFNRFGRYPTLGAYQSKESPYADWFTFEEFPDKYDCWWGFITLPAIRKENPNYRHYLMNQTDGIMARWIRRGACGWRLDVADELPMDLIREMRTCVKQADPDATLLGEVWEDASNKIAYGVQRSYCLGDALDSVMNYPLRRAVIDFFNGLIGADHLRRVILNQQEVYPAPFFYSLLNLLGSHDRLRILNAMCGLDNEGGPQMDREEAGRFTLTPEQYELAKARYVEAFRLLCALPGAPTVYYGDEVGLTGMADPWCRGTMPWDSMDMDLHDQIASLLHERSEHPVLQTGCLSIEAPNADTLLIRRFTIGGRDVFGSVMEDGDRLIRITRS